MNAEERAKVGALNRLVRIPEVGYGYSVVKNLTWRMEHNTLRPLSPKEKYLLDKCVWHYRAKLGGLVAFEIPPNEPVLADYVPYPQQPTQPQRSLL